MTGIRLFELMSSKRRPADPDSIPDVDLFQAILGTAGGNAVVAALDGDVSRLAEFDIRNLAGYPHIGKGRAGQLIAIYLLSVRHGKNLASQASASPEQIT